jgi:hypothetical protein
MDSDAPRPAQPDAGGVELEEAIREASHHLGVRYSPETPAPPPPKRVDWRNRAFFALVVLTWIAILGGTYLLSIRTTELDPHRVEVDLRWAVAEVVEEIERQRSISGELPRHEDLHGLLGEAISYTLLGSSYRIVGSRGDVRVEFDGSIPLDEWRALVFQPPGRP